jgi:pSer/pThr/pTyr-binding forkhead associated (FHA) protein
MPLLVKWAGGERVMDGPFTAGRRADLVVDDAYASPSHAQFSPGDYGWTVADLGSTNGTRLNARRVYGPVVLAKGDEVRIGRTPLLVVPF